MNNINSNIKILKLKKKCILILCDEKCTLVLYVKKMYIKFNIIWRKKSKISMYMILIL